MSASVLLVEDDLRIREALSPALADEGFTVVSTGSGHECLALIRTLRVQVAVLDLALPAEDGLAVCQALREHGDLPIIVIADSPTRSDVIAGLEAGADDYVTKPVVACELAGRLRVLLGEHDRSPGTLPGQLLIGDVEVCLDQGIVRRGGILVRLTRTEWRSLRELVSARGRTVTRRELLRRVWGYRDCGDPRLLEVHIRRLRHKIETDLDAPQLLHTMPDEGYQIRA